jgi:hypothetical protein
LEQSPVGGDPLVQAETLGCLVVGEEVWVIGDGFERPPGEEDQIPDVTVAQRLIR